MQLKKQEKAIVIIVSTEFKNPFSVLLQEMNYNFLYTVILLFVQHSQKWNYLTICQEK